MILIADGGSSSIKWCLLDKTEKIKEFTTTGMNPVLLTQEEMAQRVSREVGNLFDFPLDQVERIYYYGAGCRGGEYNKSVEKALKATFPSAVVAVDSDMAGAAKALCGNQPGIACILGTGSNSCLYDGEKIIDSVAPLGYILGDEGSGAVLGRMLVGDVFKKQLPSELCLKFRERFDLDLDHVLHRVYGSPEANRFLASLTPFLAEYIEEPAIHRLVLNAFKAFFVRNVAQYMAYKTLPVNFTGSVAYHFRDVLGEAASAIDCNIGKVIPSPMEGLINYHLRNNI